MNCNVQGLEILCFACSAHDSDLRHDHGPGGGLEFGKVAGGAVFNHLGILRSEILTRMPQQSSGRDT